MAESHGYGFDPARSQEFVYLEGGREYIYQNGSRITLHELFLDQEPQSQVPLPPHPSQTLTVRCPRIHQRRSFEFYRDLALKQHGEKANHFQLHIQFFDDVDDNVTSSPSKTVQDEPQANHRNDKPRPVLDTTIVNSNIRDTLPKDSGQNCMKSEVDNAWNENAKEPPITPISSPKPCSRVTKVNKSATKILTQSRTNQPASKQTSSEELKLIQQREQLLHHIVQWYFSKFRIAIGYYFASTDNSDAETGTSSNSNSRGGGKRQQSSSKDTGSQNTPRKRSLGQSSQDDENEDNSDNDGSNDSPQGKRTKTGSNRLFACPYFKYNEINYKRCERRGFATTHRIKEHLYRCHSEQRLMCQRCGYCFEKLPDLQRHLRAKQPCKLNMNIPEGFSYEQEKQLKKRTRPKEEGKMLTEEIKWEHIYHILFPHVKEQNLPIPPPYVKTELDVFEDFVKAPFDMTSQKMLQEFMKDDPDAGDIPTVQRIILRFLQFYRTKCEAKSAEDGDFVDGSVDIGMEELGQELSSRDSFHSFVEQEHLALKETQEMINSFWTQQSTSDSTVLHGGTYSEPTLGFQPEHFDLPWTETSLNKESTVTNIPETGALYQRESNNYDIINTIPNSTSQSQYKDDLVSTTKLTATLNRGKAQACVGGTSRNLLPSNGQMRKQEGAFNITENNMPMDLGDQWQPYFNLTPEIGYTCTPQIGLPQIVDLEYSGRKGRYKP